jgi:hypothetical protein
MVKARTRDGLIYLLLFVGVLISRLPFVDNGYGVDQDAWRVAGVAESIHATGQYSASRLPGYPVQEITFALLPTRSAMMLNLLTAALSALCVVFFAKLMQRFGVAHPLLAAAAFAFVPVIFVNSVSSMDYLWALCFVMIALHCSAAGKYFLSGVLLGIAAGCRITSAGMMLPAVFLLWAVNRTRRPGDYAKLIAGFLLALPLVLSPVVMKYGWRFLPRNNGIATALGVAKNLTVDLWGILGVLALAAFSIVAVIRLFQTRRFREFLTDPINQLCLMVIAVYGLAYSIVPYESGYLIPIVPFIIMLLVRSLPAWQSVVFLLAMALSSFVIGMNTADMPWSPNAVTPSAAITIGGRIIGIHALRGPIMVDRMQRMAREAYTARVIGTIASAKKGSVFVCGDWFIHLAVELHQPVRDNIEEFNAFEYHSVVVLDVLDTRQIRDYRRRDVPVYYLTGLDQYISSLYHYSLRDWGAQEVVW